jgi:hypothetical protein
MIKPGRTSTTGLTCNDAMIPDEVGRHPDDPDDLHEKIDDHQLGQRSDGSDLRKGRNPDGSDDQLGHLVRARDPAVGRTP